VRAIAIAVVLGACGSGSHGDPGHIDAPGSGGGSDAHPNPDGAAATLRDRMRQLATDLRGRGDFMIGVGNDNSGPYTAGVPMDLHYAYLDGYGDQNGWPTWNTNGDYPLFFIQADMPHGVTSMFTYYQLALELENSNDAVLADATRMNQYLSDMRLLFDKITAGGQPAAVNIEPDFFGYLMARAGSGTPPDQLAAAFSQPECPAFAQNVTGLLHCVIAIARAHAPAARIGFHASMWGAWYDVTDPNADIETAAKTVADFLISVGADQTDFVTVETLDRDAGFWETNGGGSTCSVTGGSRGAVYWDETNATLPNFAQHVRWVKALTGEMGLPALEWQTPIGQPSPTCGGSTSHWRDNRVHYFFGHVGDLVDAGIAGMTFGTGAGGQTTIATDGDELKTSSITYLAAPFAL
jgi:hypothetical protein